MLMCEVSADIWSLCGYSVLVNRFLTSFKAKEFRPRVEFSAGLVECVW